MPPSRHTLPALIAASGLVLACSAAAAAQETDIPGGTVATPDARIQVRAGSYVLVCANGMRVAVRPGAAPPCEPAGPERPEPEPTLPPDPVPPVEPERSADPGVPEPPAEAGREVTEPATAAPAPAPAEPGASAPAEDPVAEDPSASPVPAPDAPEPVDGEILAGLPAPGGQETAGAFTPMRTMAVAVVVAALAAGGAGRAAARRTV